MFLNASASLCSNHLLNTLPNFMQYSGRHTTNAKRMPEAGALVRFQTSLPRIRVATSYYPRTYPVTSIVIKKLPY